MKTTTDKPLLVYRPADPALARRRALDILALPKERGKQEFQRMLLEQEYRFIGFLGDNKTVVDSQGHPVDCLQPGDSFVEDQGE